MSLVVGTVNAITRRERKKQETKQALEQAALRLFAERGYEQTTVEEIADAADVAVRTFFRYFASKQHVLFGDVVTDRVSRLRGELAARPVDEPVVKSIDAVMELLDLSGPADEHQILVRMNLMRAQPSLVRQYWELIDQMRLVVVEFTATRTGLDPTRDMYPLLVAGACAASWDAALTLWTEAQGRLSLCELGRAAFHLLSRGLEQPPVPAKATKAVSAAAKKPLKGHAGLAARAAR